MAAVPDASPRQGRLGFGLYVALGLTVGGGLLALLFQRLGAAATWAEFLAVWPVSLLVLPWFMLPLAAAGESWRRLFPRTQRPPRMAGTYLTWLGLGVNWLLPVAMVGGELVKLRLGLKRGWRPAALVASLVGDKTAQVTTQLLFGLLGLALLAGLGGRLDAGWQALLGLGLFALAVYAFYRMQQGGLFGGLARRLAVLAGVGGRGVRTSGQRVDASLRRMYRRRRAWWAALAWRMLFRVLLAFEIWLVFRWLGQPIGVAEAVALEALAQGARAAAFFVPAGIGAQEGGLVTAGLVLGLPGETLLAAALVKRVRELVIGGAGLLAWQCEEAGRLWRDRRPAARG